MTHIFDFIRGDCACVSFVAQNILVEVLLVVHLAYHLGQTLWRQRPVGFAGPQRVDTHTLSQ